MTSESTDTGGPAPWAEMERRWAIVRAVESQLLNLGVDAVIPLAELKGEERAAAKARWEALGEAAQILRTALRGGDDD